MSSIGIPRAVSDDEMAEYPAVKRRRDASRNNAMEVETPLSESSLLSQDDVLIEVCATGTSCRSECFFL